MFCCDFFPLRNSGLSYFHHFSQPNSLIEHISLFFPLVLNLSCSIEVDEDSEAPFEHHFFVIKNYVFLHCFLLDAAGWVAPQSLEYLHLLLSRMHHFSCLMQHGAPTLCRELYFPCVEVLGFHAAWDYFRTKLDLSHFQTPTVAECVTHRIKNLSQRCRSPMLLIKGTRLHLGWRYISQCREAPPL